MRKFIFLTPEGSTQTPTGDDIENLQVLGTAEGVDEEGAFKSLVKENNFLFNAGYEDVLGMELKSERRYNFSFNEI
jgi:hypothetical protein